MTDSNNFRKVFPIGSFVWFFNSVSQEWEIGVVRNHIVLDPVGFLNTENAIQVEEHIYLYSTLRQEKPPVRRIEGVK